MITIDGIITTIRDIEKEIKIKLESETDPDDVMMNLLVLCSVITTHARDEKALSIVANSVKIYIMFLAWVTAMTDKSLSEEDKKIFQDEILQTYQFKVEESSRIKNVLEALGILCNLT